MKLLLAEDEPELSEALQVALHAEGFEVTVVRTASAAVAQLVPPQHDLLVLDLGLDNSDGFEVLEQLRQHQTTVPVLVLTARLALDDRLRSFEWGADDYLAKPFELKELLARLKAISRRYGGKEPEQLQRGFLMAKNKEKTIYKNGKALRLSVHEYEILLCLMQNTGSVSRDVLESRLYQQAEETGSNLIEVYIHRLRKKVGTDVIKNMRGIGYLLCLDE